MNGFNWETFTQFGLAGLILGVFFITLVFVLRQHASTIKGVVDRMSKDYRDSNEAWRLTFEAHSNRADIRQAETNTVLRDLTKVMAENNVCISHLQGTYKDGRREVKDRANS